MKGINRERVREAAIFEIEELLEEALDRAKMAGISLSELEERLRILHTEKEQEKNE